MLEKPPCDQIPSSLIIPTLRRVKTLPEVGNLHWLGSWVEKCQHDRYKGLRKNSVSLQILPPPLPPSPPLRLISPYIWKNISISLCSVLFRRSASALARSMLRILISATLWLRFCCSRLTRRTATCRSRTSLQRSNLQHIDMPNSR